MHSIVHKTAHKYSMVDFFMGLQLGSDIICQHRLNGEVSFPNSKNSFIMYRTMSNLLWVRAAFRISTRPTLTIFTAMIMRMRYDLASTCLTYRYIQTYIHTYIHKYSDFLVVLISVGLAQARPNHNISLHTCTYTISCMTVGCFNWLPNYYNNFSPYYSLIITPHDNLHTFGRHQPLHFLMQKYFCL